MSAIEIVRPQRSLQSVDRVVRDADGVFLVLEGDGGEDGAEDLFLRDAHLVVDLREDGRLDIGAAGILAHLTAAERELRAFALADLDIGFHALHLVHIDHGAHERAGVERVARLHHLADLLHLLDEFVMDVLLDEKARRGDADLAGVEEDAHAGALRGGVEILAVVEDDVRRLAAAFEAHMLHVRLGGIFQEVLADFGRAGEGDHVDIHVAAKGLARRFAHAGQHVEDAVRNARFGRDLGEAESGKGRLFGGLQDHGIARGKRRAELPCGHEEREVPRHDRGDDAERLARDHGERVAIGRRDLVIDLVDRLGIPLDGVHHASDVDIHGEGDGLAHVERFEKSEFVRMLLDEPGEFQERLLAILRIHFRPDAALEGAAGGLHSDIDIRLVAGRDLSEELSVHGRHAFEGLAACRVDELAVDEGLVAVGEGGGAVAIVDGGGHG